MLRFHLLVLLFFGIFASFTTAASAPLFCKCTCFKNSTLIQLGAQAACAQCTHAFCLSQNLPICKDAADADVLSTCIQRDSRKDQIIVWGFILGTTGLLAWAAARRIDELRQGKTAAARPDPPDRVPYTPVPTASR
ncbi:putative MFS transporter [Xylaria cf. heliscus]|nr:putative MFS transporter [Xylaria cf. heliscus]